MTNAAHAEGRPASTATRRAFAVGVVLAVALVHILRLGAHLPATLHSLYYGYASDILVPLGAYFLLALAESNLPFLRGRWPKALVVFGVASAAEVLQGFGAPILGRTFDPLDFVMFAAGVSLALWLDRLTSPGPR